MVDLVERLREYTPHVYREGSRQHVISWAGYTDARGVVMSESTCTEPCCEINRPRNLRLAARPLNGGE